MDLLRPCSVGHQRVRFSRMTRRAYEIAEAEPKQFFEEHFPSVVYRSAGERKGLSSNGDLSSLPVFRLMDPQTMPKFSPKMQHCSGISPTTTHPTLLLLPSPGRIAYLAISTPPTAPITLRNQCQYRCSRLRSSQQCTHRLMSP